LKAYKPSRAILWGTRELDSVSHRIGGKDQLTQVFKELDLRWQGGKFMPTPEPAIKQMFSSVHLTSTGVLHLILAWQEIRTIRDLETRG
jgi:hypothetical protein